MTFIASLVPGDPVLEVAQRVFELAPVSEIVRRPTGEDSIGAGA